MTARQETSTDPRKALINARRRLTRDRSYANLINTAAAERQVGRIGSAVSLLREAVKLDFSQPEAWNNLGQCTTDMGDFDEAPAYFQRALQCIEKKGTPISAAHNVLLGFAYSMMRLGQFKYIWPVWETARIGVNWQPFPGMPIWVGEPTENLLVFPEGGYGDGFCFLRWLPYVKARRVTLLIWPGMLDFANTALQAVSGSPGGRALPGDPSKTILGANPRKCGPSWLTVHPLTHQFQHSELQQYTACTSILSLPGYCGMGRWKDIPPPLDWRPGAYFDLGQPMDRIGFCWRAEENGSARMVRSLGPQAANAVSRKLASRGAEVLSLCPRGANLAKPDAIIEDRFLPSKVRQDDAAVANWEATARTILHCKLVVTVDTAVAHLAGSLGVPTLCLLPLRSDWKWGIDEGFLPRWYGSGFRLFRNPHPVTWNLDWLKEALDPMV
jgi:hypothetical protein